MPDFKFKSQFPIADIVGAIQKKPVLEQQMEQSQADARQQRLKTLLDALSTGAQISRATSQDKNEALARKQTESQMGGQQRIQDILAEPAQTTAVASPIQQFQAPAGPLPEGGQPMAPVPSGTVQPTYGQTQQGGTQDTRLLAALAQSAPDEFAQNALQNHFGTTKSGYGGIAKPQNYVDANGQIRVGYWDPKLKKVVKNEESDELAGYAQGLVTDPFGRQGALNRATGTVKPIEQPELTGQTDTGANNALVELRQKNPKIAGDIEKIREQAFPQNNTNLRDTVSAAAAANTAKQILSDPNPDGVGLKSLGFSFAIMAGSNSQLSDAERQQFEQPLAFLRRLENTGYKFIWGDLSPKMKDDLLRLATIYERKARIKAKSTIDGAKLQAKGTAGSYWNDGLGKTFPTVDELVSEEQMNSVDAPAGGGQADPLGIR